MVTAQFPAFGRRGQTIDVVVSSMGNAKSLRGGTLLMTPLKGSIAAYALAQGNILVGGAGAAAGGSSVQVNQLNGGRITNGATIERELPSQFGGGNTINLQLNNEDFTMAQQITDTINRSRGFGSATALDHPDHTSACAKRQQFAGTLPCRHPEYGGERHAAGREGHYQLAYGICSHEP